MDHHCPWINNCVGIGNHKFFLLFLFYVCLASVYSIGIIGARFIHCASGATRLRRRRRETIPPTVSVLDPSCNDIDITETMLMFSVVVEGLLFGLFTLCMMCDQSSVVLSAMTNIDRMKGEVHDQQRLKRSKRSFILHNLAEVFGGDPNNCGVSTVLSWLVPMSMDFKDKERMLGYKLLRDELDLSSVVPLQGIGEKEVELERKETEEYDIERGNGDNRRQYVKKSKEEMDMEMQEILNKSRRN